MRATVEVGDGEESMSRAECDTRDRVMRGHSATSGAAQSLVELMEELHRASRDARAQSFPLMAQHLDDCGFALPTALAGDRRIERALVERARECLEVWRVLREW